MRYQVSGPAGFVPSPLCGRILDDGHEVEGVDNFLTGHSRNVAHLREPSRFVFVEHAVCQPLPDLGTFDCMIHAALPASPKDDHAHPIATLDVGSIG